MRDSIVLLDRFIKDTTHELNTPLSAILANIEMMDTKIMAEKNRKKLARINIASKMVSILYKDLTYLTLEQERQNNDEFINIPELIDERTEYFAILVESKKIKFILDLEEATIFIDRRKFTRVIDNLISNAIKYNNREGSIGIEVKDKSLIVWDTGIGIDKDKIPFMFDRYTRFNHTEGGFGVGLSIVKTILDEYKIEIKITSIKKEGTKMILTW
jgi:two-component system OmpR family sensor kinase